MGSKKSLVQTDADSASMNSQSIPEDDYSSFFSVVLDGATDSRGEEETLYECRRCGNRYGRVDHIKRHYQSHENGRAFRCTKCPKSFNRKDLLNRHRAIHASGGTLSGDRPKKTSRIAQACHQCIQAKTKCSDERPCKRCRKRGETCDGEVKLAHFTPGAPVEASTLLSDNHYGNSAIITSSSLETYTDAAFTAMATPSTQQHDRSLSREYTSVAAPIEESFEAIPPNFEWNTTYWDGLASLFDPSHPSNDYGFGLDDDTLMAMSQDWSSFIEPRRTQQAQTTGAGLSKQPDAGPSTQHGLQSRILSGHEIFQKSPWVWEPDPRDSASTEEAPQLSEAEEQQILPRNSMTRTPTGLRLPDLTCGSKQRDALLLLAQQNSGPGVVVQSFPSANILSLLLRNFVALEESNHCPFIHFPTLALNECRIELLSAMITSASTTSSGPEIWKFGLALQERTRLAIYKALDFDNTIARRLDILQAQILWIETGSWSGSHRKMEVAESAAGNVPTMIRRAGVMTRGYYEHSMPPSREDDSETLRSKWLKWVELESFKRCVIRAIINDMQSSVAYMRNTCFYSTDFTFTLPAPRELWEASDPDTWRTLYLNKRQETETGKLTLREAVQDPSILRGCTSEYDHGLSLFAALHCLWPQLGAYLDAKALNQGIHSSSKSLHGALWLEGLRQDLYRRLGEHRDLLRSTAPHIAEANMVCELFMMSLFVSPADIQKLAGRFGVKESRSTIPNLKAWSESEEPRYAMWHAGQVLHAAQRMAPTQLHGFYAIAVYQACLTLASPFLLQAFGRASTAASPEPGLDPAFVSCQLHDPAQKDYVILNGQESMQTKTYLLTGQGSPALSLENETKALSSVDIIPEAIAGIFRKNHFASTDHLPPLLEQLIILVRDLARLTGRPE